MSEKQTLVIRPLKIQVEVPFHLLEDMIRSATTEDQLPEDWYIDTDPEVYFTGDGLVLMVSNDEGQ